VQQRCACKVSGKCLYLLPDMSAQSLHAKHVHMPHLKVCQLTDIVTTAAACCCLPLACCREFVDDD
jgi:hypothetical protein